MVRYCQCSAFYICLAFISYSTLKICLGRYTFKKAIKTISFLQTVQELTTKMATTEQPSITELHTKGGKLQYFH